MSSNGAGKKDKLGVVNLKKLKMIKKIVREASIRKKLIAFFLLVSLGPILLVGSISYLSSRAAINKKITDYSGESLTQTVMNLQLKLNKYEDISMQMLSNREINDLLQEYVQTDDLYGRIMKTQRLTEYLQGHLFTDSSIYGFLFLPEGDQRNFSLVGASSGTVEDEFITSLKSSSFYRKVLAAAGKMVISPPMIIDGNNVILLARQMRHVLSGEKLGVFAVCITEESLNSIINFSLYNGEEKESGKEETGKFAVLIDTDGTIISTPDKDLLGKDISQVLLNAGSLKEILAAERSGERESTVCHLFGRVKKKEALITFRAVGESGWYLLSAAPTSYLYAEAGSVGRVTLLIGLLTAVGTVYFSLSVSSGISSALNRVMTAMRKAEEGDLTVRVTIENKDELGALGWSFNHMIEQMNQVVFDTKQAIAAVLDRSTVLKESSEQSAQSAENVAAAMEEITKGTMEQTAETERSSAQMNELAVEIDRLVAEAGEVEKITNSTKALSLQTKDTVSLLIEKTNETDDITDTVRKDIDELNVSAAEITKITEVIANISEQTNLLALNAAIEAARAGEAGRGFAVVADEVNKLAIQSKEAVKTINDILEAILVKTRISAQTVGRVHATVEEQMTAVRLVEKTFEAVIKAMDEIVHRMVGISEKINRIDELKDRTVQSIMNISSISEETAASAEEVSASSEEQTAIAEQVKNMVEELRVMAENLTVTINIFKFYNSDLK